MRKQILVNKPRGLYGKLLCRLVELEHNIKLPKDNFLPYADVREKLGRNFSIKKHEVMELIFFLRDTGFLEISQVGIKLNFEVKDE